MSIPRHIAIIMDGNGRWAKKRMLPRSFGHKKGARNLKRVVKAASNLGISYLTVYAFSTENWKRPESEVDYLMKLFVDFIDEYDAELSDAGIPLRFQGERSSLPENIRLKMEEAERRSEGRPNMQLILAFNYGGRNEIKNAVHNISVMLERGLIKVSDITEEMISKNLFLPDVPDPDLIIRTGGEKRLSNFLIWESAYSEFYSTGVLWPDFSETDLKKALDDFSCRDRRYGGINNEESK